MLLRCYAFSRRKRDLHICFGEHCLRASEGWLDGPQGPVKLGDRACQILKLLLDRPNSIVSKNDIFDEVWPNLAVEENTLQVHISTLRKALGPASIKTVHGRGYRYVGPAPLIGTAGENDDQSAVASARSDAIDAIKPGLTGTPRTSVLVMPFSNISTDAAGELVSEGLQEDIVVELGRYRHLSVTPCRKGAQGAPQDVSIRALAQDVAIDFILEGSLRLTDHAARLNACLIDAASGAQVWGERFDFEMADVFSVQDAIVDAVISHLVFNLDDAAGAKRLKDPTTSKTAYTYFLKARSVWRTGKEVEAMQLAQKAVEVDPDYGRAHAYVAFFYGYSLFSQHLGIGSDETMALAQTALDRALACDPNDPFILQKLSMTKIMLGQPEDGLRLSRAALRFGARDGEIIVSHGHALIVCGAYEEGMALMEQAMALMERFAVPPGFYCGLGECRHICRDYEGSVAALDMMSDPPYDILVLKAASLARLGEVEAARRIIASAPKGFSTARYARHMARTCALPEDIAHYQESFRLAGV